MKHLSTFEQFMNENGQTLNEKLDISPDLAKVKTPVELIAACSNKNLIIHSKHAPNDMQKRGGYRAMMWIIRGLGTNNIKVDEKGFNASGYDIQFFARDSTGFSKNWTADEIFEFFMFNRQRGNKIYTTPEISIRKSVNAIYEKWYSNMKTIDSLLGTQSFSTGNKSGTITTSKHAITSDTNEHGGQKLEFDADGKMYTFYWNVYSFKPSISEGRKTSKFGYERSQKLYIIDKKSGSEILKLAQENIKLIADAIKIIDGFYKSENISPS